MFCIADVTHALQSFQAPSAGTSNCIVLVYSLGCHLEYWSRRERGIVEMKNKTPDDLDNAVEKKLNMYACVKMPERGREVWYET